jgi:hypothetical protein
VIGRNHAFYRYNIPLIHILITRRRTWTLTIWSGCVSTFHAAFGHRLDEEDDFAARLIVLRIQSVIDSRTLIAF